MFDVKYLFYFILLHSITATPQINLYYTDWIGQNESENDNALQHNCLRLALNCHSRDYRCELLPFCMSEMPWKFNVENSDHFPNFTFTHLSKQNVTSEHLYNWSAPIDLIERYQFYLNQLLISDDLSLGAQVFYNCTVPRFGPRCQYQLYYHGRGHLFTYEILRDFYYLYGYRPTTLTCYTHLKCNRGSYASCLDWSDICDGKIDCLDGGQDEEHCWELEINQCKDDEYRCMNGQCIPELFSHGFNYIPQCIDSSDMRFYSAGVQPFCTGRSEPSFQCEDRICLERSLTSSCVEERENLLVAALFSNNDTSGLKDCWSAFKRIIEFSISKTLSDVEISQLNRSIQIVKNDCPDVIYFPNVPVLFGEIYFAYKNNDLQHFDSFSAKKLLICYRSPHYNHYFENVSNISFNNMTCIRLEQLFSLRPSKLPVSAEIYQSIIQQLYHDLMKYHLSFNYTSTICNRSNMYRCINSSKCISIYRLMDAKYDCPYMDDENIVLINNTIRIEDIKEIFFLCPTTNKYISQSLVENIQCDCGRIEKSWCDDEDPSTLYIQRNILFQRICDGFIDLLPIMIGGKNETDETECEQWECDNIYTHCNEIWNCPNGADETGCLSYSTLNCSSNYHYCVSPYSNKLICLPIAKANDGHIDCLGATDEPTLCGTYIQAAYLLNSYDDFHCINPTSHSCINNSVLCNGIENCQHGDDEQFCHLNRTINSNNSICTLGYNLYRSDVEKFLCSHKKSTRNWQTIFFKLDEKRPLPNNQVKNMENPVFSSSSITQMSDKNPPRCHRGLDLRVWSNNLVENTCLCPPSYYGEQCQYQNQRISLTIKFRALSDSWETLFAIVISLIDNSAQRIIHSYEQIDYFWTRNCNTKYQIYLLYATRPKDPRKNYSIHIDIYEKISLNYRGSLLLPVTFSFLPVHRLAFFVDIPQNDDNPPSCSNDRCIHGKCLKYSNKPQNDSFCQCKPGWSGEYCTIPYICNCALDKSCIGVSAHNRSICVCPINQFGPRCLLTDKVCETTSRCQNQAECIPRHDYMIAHYEYLIRSEPFICVCPEDFTGIYCEIVIKKMNLSIDKDIVVSQSIFIHFLDVSPDDKALRRTTTFRTIPVRPDSIIIHWSHRFHLAFVELPKQNYYLAVFEKIYNESTTIFKIIKPSDRCLHINELFNETLIQLDPLRLIKYYHLPCQKQSLNLSCFYDYVHLCLCYDFGEKRLANCFNFDHNLKFDCSGRTECQNDAQCFQDESDCPTRSICMCRRCFYGRQCQFSTHGFGLSLDGILGYHILPDLTLTQQPFITQLSLTLTIIFLIAGFVDSILCIITFKNKSVREVGCGVYLFGSSMTTLFTMIMFGLKFLILFLTQIRTISNQSFLSVQCHSIDFILRVCFNMNQWLNACVAIERAATIIKETSFDKKKSRQAAKFVILILLIVVIGTSIHDPIYRHVINEVNDVNEKRIWCIITYPSSLQVYDYIIHIFHFFGSFTINLVSAVILITKKSRQQANVHKHRPYKQILREQFRQHRHLLIAPIVLVILAVPRLIIAFVSKCMESANESWLFLGGYFISFIPLMVTSIIFILPSEFYRKELRKTLAYYRTHIQRRLRFTS